MSLGFNHNRKYRSSTLPGSVNMLLVRERPALRRKSPLAAPTTVVTPVSTTLVAPAAPRAVVAPPTAARPSARTPDETHTVYATAAAPLVSAVDGSVAAQQGERVLLVYPMASNVEDGRITMNLKSVHPATAQLSYTPVTVYDPNTETRYATDFSLTP